MSFETPHTSENTPEQVPTEQEIAALFEELTNGEEFLERRKLEDEHGVYLWEISRVDANGEVTEYSYMRAGRYPEGESSNSAVHVYFFDAMGIPQGGHSIARYENGIWVKTLQVE